MKKLLTIIFVALLMVGTLNAEEKVKVYMFEAGGCPYCEAEEEYLTGLDGYGEKFELIKKELYVDHVDWAEGKDYELGKKVAEVFNDAGYEDASYYGTPFVIISDIYAAASYSTSLEDYINLAYEEGDKDAVSCIAEGKEDCVRFNEDALNKLSTKASGSNKTAGIVLAVVGGLLLIAAVIYIIKSRPTDEEVSEVKEEKVVEKKVATKKATTKKKTTAKKKTK